MVNVAEKLADTIKSRGVALAYGEPIETGDASILPIALVSYGFGGGGDADEGGGGGGGAAIPLGVYVTRDSTTRFHPNLIALLGVLVPVLCVTGRAIARIVKAATR